MRRPNSNRVSIEKDERALAAVLAVVMLIGVVILIAVAITIMLIVLVDDQPEQAPIIGFTENELEDRWIVTTAPERIPWSAYEIRVTGNSGTVKVRLNADAGASGLSVTAIPQSLPGGAFPGDVTGGQFLDFCAAADEPTATIILVHTQSQAIAKKFAFQRLTGDASCS